MNNGFNANEYEQIIDYIQAVNKSHNFELDALKFLKKLVDFDQGFFVISESRSVTIKMAYERDVDSSVIKNYNEFYHRNVISGGVSSHSSKKPEAGEVMAFNMKEYTDYSYHSLFESDAKPFKHNCFFLINENGDGVHLFRYREDNPFQDAEIARCRYLAPIIGNAYLEYLQAEEMKKDAALFTMLQNSMYFGALVFDRSFSLIKANKIGIVRMSEVTGKEMAAEMVADFAAIIKSMINEEEKVENHLTIYKTIENYIIELVVHYDFDESQNLTRHYIVFIYKKQWFNSMMTSSLDEVINQYDLTEREKQIVYLIVCGYSNNQIADELYISLYTVKEHIKSIFRKMNLNSRGELIIKVYSERS